MAHWIAKPSRSKIIKHCVGRPFLTLNEWIWNRLPHSVKGTPTGLRYGKFIHSAVQLNSDRTQVHGTFFLRNRPELALIRSLAVQKARGDALKITVLACSNGAEVYSIVWAIRSVRPDLDLHVHAVDISEEVVQVARRGVYSLDKASLVREHILKRLTSEELTSMFDREGDSTFRIKLSVSEGITWHVGDANDSSLTRQIGAADIVVANKFLCHMQPPEAEECLRNLVRFVKPGGYLFVSGVDLNVRTKVALDLGWVPVPDLLREIHDGDPSVRGDWPQRYWGLEPFDSAQPDWKIRYAAVFKVGSPLDIHEINFSSSANKISRPAESKRVTKALS